jgi:hypothetical protein
MDKSLKAIVLAPDTRDIGKTGSLQDEKDILLARKTTTGSR